MAKKLNPKEQVIEYQKKIEQENNKGKTQELEVTQSSTKDTKIDKTWAILEGQNIQLLNLIERQDEMFTLLRQNFKKLNEKIEVLIAKPIPANSKGLKEFTDKIEEVKNNKKEEPKLTKKEYYEQEIMNQTGWTLATLEAKAKNKQDELKGMISTEGALFMIAKENDVKIVPSIPHDDDIVLKVIDIQEGMKSIQFVGEIINISNIREFDKKDGSQGKVVNITIKDDNDDKIRVVIWDDKVDDMKAFEIGDWILIEKGYAKFSNYSNNVEINLSQYSSISKVL